MSTNARKPRRNAPCPCGSGKKYKACCLRAEEAKPKMSVDAMLERAWQAVAQHDVEGTLLWFRQVLAVQPKHAMALAGLGQALCWQERVREGLGYLREAARQLEKHAEQTRNVQFVMELADQLHHWGDLDTALRLIRLAAHLAPTLPAVHNNLALYLLRVNRPEEALPHARKARELMPDNPACQNLLAIIEAQLGHLESARAGFEQVIANPQDLAQTARAWQELALVLDRLGEYDAAFEACGKAKGLQSMLPDFRQVDRELVFRILKHHRAGFDRALLHRWSLQDYADDLPAPIFLMGFLRSGTTLTEQVLNAHPDVLASDENGLIHELTQIVKRTTGCGDDLPAGLRQIDLTQARQLRAHYWQRVQAEYGEEALRKRFVDKVALNSIDAGFISLLFPEAKILFALRDPRDVCLSCYLQTFKPVPVTINLSSWEGIARQYAAVMDLWLHLRPMIAPSYLEFRYEDAVTDFENTYRQVFALLGLEWTPEVAAFHEKAKGRYIATPSFAAVSQPLYTRSVGRWRHYAAYYPRVLPVLEPYLDAFGYL